MPRQETLLEERDLILRLDARLPVRSDLLAVALTVGSRYFTRDLLLTIFREELQMLKEASIVEDWIAEGEARGRAEGEARGRAEGEARGRAEGEARGRAEGEATGAREVLETILRRRFGKLPSSLLARIQGADAAWCRETAARAVEAASLEELGLD
jgi:predicted transposase YdaD